MDYPIWEPAMGGGLLMAIVAVAHVIVSHFAIGGGLLIVVTESLAVKRGDVELRDLARRSSLILILVLTGFMFQVSRRFVDLQTANDVDEDIFFVQGDVDAAGKHGR